MGMLTHLIPEGNGINIGRESLTFFQLCDFYTYQTQEILF